MLSWGKLALFPLALALAGGTPAQAQRPKVAMKAIPVGNVADWFPPDSYPKEAVRSARQGRTVVNLVVSAEGKVLTCTVMESSGTAHLDARTCELAVEHGRFNPATDRKGRPISANYPLPVRWQLPDTGASPVEVEKLQTLKQVSAREMRISPEGVVVSCKVIEAIPKESAAMACPPSIIGSKVRDGFLRAGRPVGATLINRLSSELIPDPN